MDNSFPPDIQPGFKYSKLKLIESRKLNFWILSVLLFLFLAYFLFFSAPTNFPEGIIFQVEPGASLRKVSFNLKERHLIRSRVLFEALIIMNNRERHLVPADYFFENKISVFEIAKRISNGDRHLAPLKITIPEGFTIDKIAEIFSAKLPYFDKENFFILAKDQEGYLFPDTYFFFTTDNEIEVFRSLNENFKKKTETLREEIIKSGKNEEEIIIMASIVEKEAKGDQDRDVISGILWRRISLGMPLQADAAPYTYKNKGLPKAPIANPGLSSIRAALYPQISPYLYYLHDQDGNIHYAKSFTEHRQNIIRYLK